MATFVRAGQTVPTGATYLPIYCDLCKKEARILAPIDVLSLSALVRAFEDAHCECLLKSGEDEDP